MRLRLSNGFSHSVVFEAHNEANFGLALAEAWLHFRDDDRAQLHVHVGGRDWLSPSYAIGRCSKTYSGRHVMPNMPIYLERGTPPDVHLWVWCETAYRDAARLNQALGSMTDWIQREP